MRIFLLRWLVMLTFIPVTAMAVDKSGIGGMALELLDPVTVVSDFVHSACIVIGGAFLVASFIKYLEHRRSPLMMPISTVIFLAVAGLVLLLLPLISYVTSNGVPFTLLRLK